jgi:regulatory protein
MTITRILKKGNKDVTIQFDDDKFLILAVEVFLKSGLKKGDNLSEDRFSFLIEQNKLFHIKQKAFRLLGRRQHSTSELRTKLWQKDYDKSLIESVINDLNENGYLNDEDFIREFVAAKYKFKNWSSKRIKSELIKRGIAEKNIAPILSKMNISADVENAMIQAKKKYESLSKRKLEPKELRNKLAAFLFSKGFDYELIKDVCEKILKTKIEE